MTLSGRLALVVGGSSGIGEAICQALATNGATVVVAARCIQAAQRVAQSLPGHATHCALHVDVAESSSVQDLFENIRTTFPQPLSIVVNSAGVSGSSPIADCTEDLFDEILRINMKGSFLVTRAGSHEMLLYDKKLPVGGASIVNVTSASAMLCGAYYSAYAASKAGVEALTKSAAKELAPHGIRCNTVLPGWVDTPMTSAAGKNRADIMSKTPLNRVAQAQEIAEVVVFLCSPRSSSYIRGASVLATGGLIM